MTVVIITAYRAVNARILIIPQVRYDKFKVLTRAVVGDVFDMTRLHQ
jgi:hypothetical protein